MILETSPIVLEPTLRVGQKGEALLSITNHPDRQWFGDRLHCTVFKPNKVRATVVFGLPEGEAIALRDYLNFVFPPDEPRLRDYVNRLFAQEES